MSERDKARRRPYLRRRQFTMPFTPNAHARPEKKGPNVTVTMLRDMGRTVSVEELRAMVSEINVRSGLHYTTVVSSNLLRGKLEEWPDRANSFNMPLLAKAFLLWGRIEGGRAMTSEDGLKLLRAINSLPWYSELAGEFATDDAVLSLLIRQGFQRFYTDDPLDARIARTWIMFSELVKEGGLEVPDPSGELQKLIGVSVEDLWVIGFMFYIYHFSVTALDGRKSVFDPRSFVQEGTRQQEMAALVARVLQTVALTPQGFRDRYNAPDSKYRDQSGRVGYWLSEFNIARDFPIVSVGDGCYCSPYPTFALTRALDGFYYDLLNEFARRKIASGAKDNPYDNIMAQTVGRLFERYVGRQLRLLPVGGNELRGEFTYRHKKQDKDSTDWILNRPARLPVLFECKAREAVLDLQRYGSADQIRTEVGKAIGKACRQLVRFIQAIDEKAKGLEQYHGLKEFICAVVLQAPLPFHMLRDIRIIIEQVATEMEPGWAAIRGRIHFVPMSIRELETAVATELQFGVPIEDQLYAYAQYREQVRRVETWDGGMPVFPRHLEEFLQERYGGGRRIVNSLCARVWDDFGAFCQNRIFGEPIDVAERELFELTQKCAYERWEKRGKPLWDDQRDWFAAENEITNDPSLSVTPSLPKA